MDDEQLMKDDLDDNGNGGCKEEADPLALGIATSLT